MMIGCSKNFLEEKPNSDIVIPSTIEDFTAILDNADVMNVTGALSQLASDEYFISSFTIYQSLPTVIEKNSYIWNKDLYGGGTQIQDWNALYATIYCSNSVLSELAKSDLAITPSGRNIEGWAKFCRAYAMYDLARNFTGAYDSATASHELGIPLRTTPEIDVLIKRSSLQQTYEHILNDLKASAQLLVNTVPNQYRNRPSRTAAYAAMARVYLSMRDYKNAESAVDSCLKYYNKLINYNSVSQTSTTPFTYTSDETIYYTRQIIAYSSLTSYSATSLYSLDTVFMASYITNDLRRPIYFRANSFGYFRMNRGYVGGGVYPFTGLATDEMYLIKAECATRRNDVTTALTQLNNLLVNRFKTGTYVPINLSLPGDVLNKVLDERKKELIWRSLRWSDIKRLNLEGRGIQPQRILNNQVYHLAPKDPKYIFPIPDDEILLSGIEQNNR